MKKLVNLKGVKSLNRQQQKSIFGGFNPNKIPIPCGGNCGGGSDGGGSSSCSADCQGGGQVTCSGYTCLATDNYGCESYDQDNNEIDNNFCPEA